MTKEEPSKLDSEREALLREEEKISKNVLKIVDPKLYSLTSFETKQKEFKDTCMAIQAIVCAKLYRCVSGSLEGYFKKRWSVSRAQTYRLFECASVLKILNDVEIIPHKERICRQLKNSAGLVGTRLIELWKQVLLHTGGQEGQINSFNIEEFWSKNYGPTLQQISQEHGLKPKLAKSAAKRKNSARNDILESDTEYSDDLAAYSEYQTSKRNNRVGNHQLGKTDQCTQGTASGHATLHNSPLLQASKELDLGAELNYNLRPKSRFPSANASTAGSQVHSDAEENDKKATHNIKNKKIDDDDFMIQKDWMNCQQSMKTLAANGYRVESLINGEWMHPAVWKLTRAGQDEYPDNDQISGVKPSLEYLVMAAEWAYTDCQ